MGFNQLLLQEKMTVGGVYREHQLLYQPRPNPTLPEEAQIDRWLLLLESWKLAGRKSMCTVLGDMNLDYLRWENPDQAHAIMVDTTKDEIESEGFTQVIRGRTRQWRGQANTPNRLISTINEDRAISDHNYTSFLLRTKGKVDTGQDTQRRIWKHFDPETFREKIRQIDWSDFYNCENIDLLNDFFVEKVNSVLDTIAPMKNCQWRKKHCNWVNDELIQKIKERDQAREVARETDLHLDWIEYRRLQNDCTKAQKKRKNEFFKHVFEKNIENSDVKNTYRMATNLMGWSPPGPPKMFLVRGVLYRKPLELVNLLKKFYIDKVESLIMGLQKRGHDPLTFLNAAFDRWEKRESLGTFTIREITRIETLDYINRLGNTSAYGDDKMDALSLKIAAEDLCNPIMHIINMSIRMRTFASRWKISRIIPVLKSKEASRMDPASFRPVALLPIISKLVERMVQIQLQHHMESKGLLNHNSHSYRTNLSTTTAILQMTDRLYTATDRNLITQLLAIDQSSAFDCVNHSILLLKLKKYGCSQETLEWMTSYLLHRSQYTNIGCHNSQPAAITRGVPQDPYWGHSSTSSSRMR